MGSMQMLVLAFFSSVMLQNVSSYYVFARYRPEYLVDKYTENLNDSLDLLDDRPSKRQVKRNAANVRPMPAPISVCQSKLVENHQPTLGVDMNGTHVEIQQDEVAEFRATFVECSDDTRPRCYGIDETFFTSECVSVYALKQAMVRPVDVKGPFMEGLIKVPIACECRLRRKMFLRA